MNKYFCRIETLVKEEGFKKIQNATVSVIGLGGVGATAAITLVRSGVKKIIIQDFDKVAESNFNRQILANLDTLNMYKTDALELLIKKINPECEVIKINEKFDDNSSLFNYQFDYLIDAIDSVDNKFLLIKTCVDKNIKFISSMGTAKKFDIKKLDIIDINKTTYDPLAKAIRRKMKENEFKAHFKVLSSTEVPEDCEILGSYMPVTSAAGLMLADYVLKEILK